MPGISTCCLMTESLPAALDRLAPLTDLIEVMDEGPHLITDPGLFESYSQKIVLHAPFHGVNVASLFEPIARIASGVGPTNTIRAASQARAKSAFSERNP